MRSNNSAIGARVEIKTGSVFQQYVVGTSSGQVAVPPYRIHAGLGQYSKVDWLRIMWPDAVLQAELELPADQVPSGCTKVHVEEERQFIIDLRNAIFAEFQKGTPAFEVPGAVKLPQYEHWAHYDDWLEINALRVMLDLWMGPYPWVPEG